MRYREHPIDAGLAPYVRVVWTLESDVDDVPTFAGPERVVADGVVEAVFHYRAPFRMRFAGRAMARQPTTLVVGQAARYLDLQPSGPAGFVSVRFHPWGAHHFYRCPTRDLMDRATAGEALWHAAAVDEVEARMAAASTTGARVAIVQTFLKTQLAAHHKNDVGGLVRAVLETPAPVRVATVCRTLGVTERHLQRVLGTAVGTTPKQLMRLARFLRVCRRLREDAATPLASVAFDTGYYDQSHLTGEFRALAGMTPSVFRANHAHVSSLVLD